MTVSNDSFSTQPHGPSRDEPAIRTFIVDSDPIFRMGLRAWLQSDADEFDVLQDMSDGDRLLPILRADLDSRIQSDALTLVLLGYPLGNSALDAERYRAVLAWCQTIKATYPSIVVVLAGTNQRDEIGAARRVKANGYLCKSWLSDDLLSQLRLIIAGQYVWPEQGAVAFSDVNAVGQVTFQEQSSDAQPDPGPRNRSSLGAFAAVRFRLRQSGLAQIDSQLQQLLPYLKRQSQYVSVVDRWIIAGRCRELTAARWMVNRILATPALDGLELEVRYRASTSGDVTRTSSLSNDMGRDDRPPNSDVSQVPTATTVGGLLSRWQQWLGAIAQQPIYQAITDSRASSSGNSTGAQAATGSPANPGSLPDAMLPSSALTSVEPPSLPSVRATLFDTLRDRLQSSLINQTEHPLEIDILREEKKRELLILILHKILALLDDLRYSEVQPQQLQERQSQLFYDLWQSILTDYFGKYYVLQVDGIEREVVAILSQDARGVQEAIFSRIPFSIDLWSHFLFQSPLEIDSVPYSMGTPEAFARAEILLDNLVIQMGNSVVYPLLNHLADVELIKQNFYQRQLMSSRDIARFRNSLSWHYRRRQWIEEPTNIFESTYTLFTLNSMGIKEAQIYSSRRAELDRLSGLPLAVTLLLELRDTLSPRLKGAIAAVGSGMIYVLTDVIGRAIGLIGRGIIKGIGSAWRDIK